MNHGIIQASNGRHGKLLLGRCPGLEDFLINCIFGEHTRNRRWAAKAGHVAAARVPWMMSISEKTRFPKKGCEHGDGMSVTAIRTVTAKHHSSVIIKNISLQGISLCPPMLPQGRSLLDFHLLSINTGLYVPSHKMVGVSVIE